jgi:eukaryotic-like serine/threonine-protein kinase
VSLPPADAALEAGLAAAFGPDSGPPLPAGASVLKALAASLPAVPQVQLRDPEGEGEAPPVRPQSEEMLGPLGPSDRYQLHGEIARGGMGAVLKGRDADLGRDIAVKVLLEAHRGKAELLRRFVEEAQIGGQLQHPGVVPVYELGQFPDQRPYFTMKLVKGQTLARHLDQRTDPAQDRPRLLKVFEQVCQTLAYAHARGVIHRDLKPANVMVGAFGEVQVMDWGLAKVLPQGGVADERPTPAEQAEASAIQTARGKSGGTAGAAGSQTQAGSVLGTPAYMAPEQARGEVSDLDERCDVFGLGAILCEILTGKPPYSGDDRATLLRQAAAGDLADAWARLDGCGADAELVALAEGCLWPERSGRLRHAGEVAAAVTGYLQSVEARLQRAEAERAAAQVKAQEERKRRRVQLCLAAAVLLLVVAGGGAGVWLWGQQVRRAERQQYVRKEVAAALQEATGKRQDLHATLGDSLKVHVLLSEPDKWKATLDAAQAVWRQAEALAASGRELLPPGQLAGLKELGEQLQADRRDFAVAEQLDSIRQDAWVWVEGKFNTAAVGPRYEKVFREAGLDVGRAEVTAVAARIRRSPLRYAWVAALDHWAETRGGKKRTAADERLVGRLLAVARAADPDPWRDQVRNPKTAVATLRKLAQAVEVAGQSPQILVALAVKLPRREGSALLRRALLAYPRDFWLHFQLGTWVEGFVERAGCYQAAVAIRPSSSAAHNKCHSPGG